MKNQSGKAGEEHIARWLESQGYEILARNFHSRYGEIDIVAQRPPYIAFVEVKARVENSLVSPFEAITPRKQRKIIATAQEYLRQHPGVSNKSYIARETGMDRTTVQKYYDEVRAELAAPANT